MDHFFVLLASFLLTFLDSQDFPQLPTWAYPKTNTAERANGEVDDEEQALPDATVTAKQRRTNLAVARPTDSIIDVGGFKRLAGLGPRHPWTLGLSSMHKEMETGLRQFVEVVVAQVVSVGARSHRSTRRFFNTGIPKPLVHGVMREMVSEKLAERLHEGE